MSTQTYTCFLTELTGYTRSLNILFIPLSCQFLKSVLICSQKRFFMFLYSGPIYYTNKKSPNLRWEDPGFMLFLLSYKKTYRSFTFFTFEELNVKYLRVGLLTIGST